MLTFVPVQDKHLLDAELCIMNSNPAYNLISEDREMLNKQDIAEDREEGKAVSAKRFLIMDGDVPAGIFEYCPLNPSDQKPWIGLFILHHSYQGKGYAAAAYETAEKLLLDEGFTEMRLGVLTENERGRKFWRKMGYFAFKEGVHKGKPIIHFTKQMK
ncbi:GNAT family N-acetyltransferase [Metabacillus indicus]|uniref:GNAT family N-acetyltransferase n=1 Tax=Metabacillus indicus TaxID=246786 RepID=UPI0004932845|nr:GNAT family N-acetyltransferase [Metabacillus indicus]KEZ52669.1 hypothetical protein AZ46_0202645 [Metabacillus indicus LMG 22858]